MDQSGMYQRLENIEDVDIYILNKWTDTIRCIISATSEATLICIDIQDGKMIKTKWKRETYANAYVGEWKKIIERENGNSTYMPNGVNVIWRW